MRIVFYWSLLALTCGYALWRGGKEERIAAMVCITASLMMPFVLGPFASRYVGIETGAVLVDCGVLAAFVAVALQSYRFWPLWVAGLQLTTIMSHAVKSVQFDLLPWAYGAATHFWSYPILLIVAIATWRGRHEAPLQPPLAA